MKDVLIDTDVLINFLRGEQTARDFLNMTAKETDLCCSAITVAELCAGMRTHERQKTAALIDGLIIVDVSREIAEKAGQIKRDTKSHALELDDCLIAATAFVRKAALATGISGIIQCVTSK
jgi:hypothetical protein